MSALEMLRLRQRNEHLEKVLREAHYPLTGMPVYFEESERIEELKAQVVAAEKLAAEKEALAAREQHRRLAVEREYLKLKQSCWMSPRSGLMGQFYHIRAKDGRIYRAVCTRGSDGSVRYLVTMPGIEMEAEEILPSPD